MMYLWLGRPLVVLVASVVVLWLCARIGAYVAGKWPVDDRAAGELRVILTASLTLLSIIIGFTFQMAGSRYDQRKGYEADEANAIGTEYVRAGLLTPAEAKSVQRLLVAYLKQRILFYTSSDSVQLQRVETSTDRFQGQMWSVVQSVAKTRATPVNTLVASGMNDVLNSQAYTQAAWWNRVPIEAWLLMAGIAICCNLMIGYNMQSRHAAQRPLIVFPLILAIAFFLIAELDTPRAGLLHVAPQNLMSLAAKLGG